MFSIPLQHFSIDENTVQHSLSNVCYKSLFDSFHLNDSARQVYSDIVSSFADNTFYRNPISFSSLRKNTSAFPTTSSYYSYSNDFSSLNFHPISLIYENDTSLYYQRKPFLTTSYYKYGPAASNAKHNPYTFWVPWTIYRVEKIENNKLSFRYIYYSPTPIISTDQTFISSVFPNSYQDGNICFGSSSSNLNLNYSPQYSRDNFFSIINSYWSGGWNNDISSSFCRRMRYLLSPQDIDSEFREEYPLLSSFLFFDYDTILKIKNLYGSLEKAFALKFSNMLDPTHYYDDGEYLVFDFRRLFLFFSTLNLEQTLNFYSEVQNLFSTVTQNQKNTLNIEDYYLYSISQIESLKDTTSVNSVNSNIAFRLSPTLNINTIHDHIYNANVSGSPTTFTILLNDNIEYSFFDSIIERSNYNPKSGHYSHNDHLYNKYCYEFLLNVFSDSIEYEELKYLLNRIIFDNDSLNKHFVIKHESDFSFSVHEIIEHSDSFFDPRCFTDSSLSMTSNYPEFYSSIYLIKNFSSLRV